MSPCTKCWFTIVLLCTAWSNGAHAQLDSILTKMAGWEDANRPERIHVHTDKPYYMAGDTVWFKVYTVIGDGQELSGWSEAVYVEFISEKDSMVAALKLPLLAGLGKGNIDLPPDLPDGNYRLRAYTQWMRNADAAFFFDRYVLVGDLVARKFLPVASYRYGDGEIAGTIRYTDQQGQPLAGKSVRYLIKSAAEQLRVGRERTDEDGRIAFNFKPKPGYDTISTFVVATIADGDRREKQTFPIRSTYGDVDVQFLPEGGQAVAGLRSRMAFKAVGADGLGMPISGELVDQSDQVVAEFVSVHRGMGVFSLVQHPGEQYTAKVKMPDGQIRSIDLPKAKSSGYVLSAYTQPADGQVLVRIQATEDRYGKVSLVLHRQGQVYYANDLDLAAPMAQLLLPLTGLPSGVAQLTLFDAKGRPVNERVVFIENDDRMHVEPLEWPDTVGQRSEMALGWHTKDAAGDPATASFSVAVTNADDLPHDPASESTIFSQLLLRSVLRGYIEEPNHYISEVTDEKRDHLDLLLLTQGFTRFNWEALLEGSPPRVEDMTYPVEKMVSAIKGKLIYLRNGKPVPNGKVSLISLKAQVNLDTVTNADGEFVFDNLLLSDSIQFTVQGETEKGGNKVEVVLDGIPPARVTASRNRADITLDLSRQLATYRRQVAQNDSVLQSLGLASRVIRLDEVTVTATARTGRGISTNLNGPGNADQVLSGNDLTACPILRACLEGRLAGVLFRSTSTTAGQVSLPYSTRGGAMLVVVDGWTLDPNDPSAIIDIVGIFEQGLIDATQIRSVEVLRSPSLTTAYGRAGQNGVIIITTTGWQRGQTPSYHSKFYAPKGFSNVREFYTPKYGVSTLTDVLADQRTTLYWNPDVRPDAAGYTRIRYVNPARPGWYRVVIEGIGADGQLGRSTFRYRVD